MDRALLSLMADTIVLEPYASQNSYGEAAYGAASTIQCRCSGKIQMVTTARGEEKVSAVTVWLATCPGVTPRDRITLPARFIPLQPEILSVAKLSDESGAYAEVVYC
jgi:hypothetical protein